MADLFRPLRLVVLAGLLLDVVLAVPALPEAGGDVVATLSLLAPGGAFNFLVAATRLGLPVLFGGLVGDGPVGRLLQDELRALGVPLLHPPVPGRDSGFDVALVVGDGERSFVTAPGCEAELGEAHLARLPLAAGDVLLVTGYDLLYPVSGESLTRFLQDLPRGVLFALDASPLVHQVPEERLSALLPRLDFLTLNQREAEALVGSAPPQLLLARLRERAPRALLVLRQGAKGAWASLPEGLLVQAPSRPTNSVDTTGAGDTHTVALLAALHRGLGLREALFAANVAASLSVERFGPGTCPSRAELEEEMRRLGNRRQGMCEG
jgi:sugar/nucleoside kinase (ribokinase family)